MYTLIRIDFLSIKFRRKFRINRNKKIYSKEIEITVNKTNMRNIYVYTQEIETNSIYTYIHYYFTK